MDFVCLKDQWSDRVIDQVNSFLARREIVYIKIVLMNIIGKLQQPTV